MQVNFKKVLMFILGCITLGLGIGFCNASKLGADPMAVLCAGLNVVFPSIAFSVWNGMINAIQICIAYIVLKRQVSIFSVIAMVVTSFGISLVPALPLQYNYLWIIIGTILMSLGIALAAKPDIGKSPYDAFIFSFMGRFNLKYSYVRWASDITFLIIGFLLGGIVGIGTIITFIFIGKLVEFFLNILDKVNID